MIRFRTISLLLAGTVLVAMAARTLSAQAGRGTGGADAPQRIDYLTFAQGAVPVAIGGAGAKLGADFEAAVRMTDGDPTAFTVADRAPAETDTEVRLPVAGGDDVRPLRGAEHRRDAESDRDVHAAGRSARVGVERDRWLRPARVGHAANTSRPRNGHRAASRREASGPLDQAATRRRHQCHAPRLVVRVQRDHRQRHAGDAADGHELQRRVANAGQSDAAGAARSGRLGMLRLVRRFDAARSAATSSARRASIAATRRPARSSSAWPPMAD